MAYDGRGVAGCTRGERQPSISRCIELSTMGGMSDASAEAITQRVAQNIRIEIADPARLADVQSAWLDLLGRAAAPNMFMSPALLRVAITSYPNAHIRVLLA